MVEITVSAAPGNDRTFCVKQGRFSLQGRADCLAHGFDVRRFFQVDTGNSIDEIQNLAD